MTSSSSSARKISEDPLLRPFLSPLFDPQALIRGVIRDGKTEECFRAIAECVDVVDDEIQQFISQHKDLLMAGMQDVASLAHRYQSLTETSRVLQAHIQRIKKEMADPHLLVRSRVVELERIHDAAEIVERVKLFVAAKRQLDAYLQNAQDQDPRSLAAAARTLQELEELLQIASLRRISVVNEHAPTIKAFGENIRLLAQAKLLETVAEKNQATMVHDASYLQVFFNLNALPEMVLVVLEETAKGALEQLSEALDLSSLSALFHDHVHKSSSSAALISSASKKAAVSGNPSSSGGNVTVAQLRLALKEAAMQWSQVVYAHATQVLILQRVLKKKEDAASRVCFIDVVKAFGAQRAQSDEQHHWLSQGALLLLFWRKMAVGMQDMWQETLRGTFHAVSCRLLPSLRAAALKMMEHVQAWAVEEQRDGGAASQFSAALSASSRVDASLLAAGETGVGVFGSLLWTHQDLLGALPAPPPRAAADLRRLRQTGSSAEESGTTDAAALPADEAVLLQALRPLQDRFLLACLERMTVPIAQMFPELEGFTAAIPSKRDLQTLIRALQAELLLAGCEGDVGLLQLVCGEMEKVLVMMLAKIENMVVASADARKISPQTQFARTQQQEHNGQLFNLLVQLRDALEALPDQLLRQLQESADGAQRPAGGGDLRSAVHAAMRRCVQRVDDLAAAILDDVVNAIVAYAQSVLFALHKEAPAAQTPSAGKPTAPMVSGTANLYSLASASTATAETSAAIQTLHKQLPLLLKSQLLVLQKSPLLDAALQEIALRLLQAFVSAAALLRPSSEAMKLRVAQDLVALELLLCTQCQLPNGLPPHCVIVRECRAFRRLLFDELLSTLPASLPRIQSLDFVQELRPSTTLNLLVGAAPSQLPATHELLPNGDVAQVLELLLLCQPSDAAVAARNQQGESRALAASRALYQRPWKRNATESLYWEQLQQALDLFCQRLAVLKDNKDLRLWYEGILDVGSQFFK